MLFSAVFPGFRITEFESALIATAVVGLVSAGIALVLKKVTSPAAFAISSLLLIVADTFVFRVTALLIPGFAMRAFYPAVAGALLLLGVHVLLLRVLRTREAAVEAQL
jgi:uncharacterized membrane protein YvlD (DUF360 family)